MKTKSNKASKNSEIQIDAQTVPVQDIINADAIKINLSGINPDLLSKSRITTEKHIYIGIDHLSQEDRKKFRGKIRRDLGRYVNQILGKDRKDEERIASIQSFLEFYKKNWKIMDFKIDNFSQSKNEMDIQDYKDLLHVVQSSLA